MDKMSCQVSSRDVSRIDINNISILLLSSVIFTVLDKGIGKKGGKWENQNSNKKQEKKSYSNDTYILPQMFQIIIYWS